MEVTFTYDSCIDILIMVLIPVVPYIIAVCLTKHKEMLEIQARNERINNFKFEEFNTWED